MGKGWEREDKWKGRMRGGEGEACRRRKECQSVMKRIFKNKEIKMVENYQ